MAGDYSLTVAQIRNSWNQLILELKEWRSFGIDMSKAGITA